MGSSATKMVHKSGPTKVGILRRIRHKLGVTAPTYGPYAFGHDEGMNMIRRPKNSTATGRAEARNVKVLVADSSAIQSQLLTRALQGRRDFDVSSVALETSALYSFMQSHPVDVVLIAGKGHEKYQIMGSTKYPFDDVLVAKKALGGSIK